MIFHIISDFSYLIFLFFYLTPAFVFAVVGKYYFIDTVSADIPASRIFDGQDASFDFRFNVRVFERQIGIDHFAVDQLKVSAAAERLST